MMLERVHPTELSREDIRWLHVGCLRSWDKEQCTPVKLCEKVVQGDAMLYRLIDRRCRGIVVLSTDHERRWLWIEVFGGSGLMRVQEEFRALLADLARSLGLKHIAGFVSREALARWYDKHTRGKPVAVLYLEGVEDERRKASDQDNRQHDEQDALQAG